MEEYKLKLHESFPPTAHATQLLMLGSLSKRISMPNFQGNAAGTVESKLTLGKYDEQGNYDEQYCLHTAA